MGVQHDPQAALPLCHVPCSAAAAWSRYEGGRGPWGLTGSKGPGAGCGPTPVRCRPPWPAYQLSEVLWAQTDIHLQLSPADRPPLRAEAAVPLSGPAPALSLQRPRFSPALEKGYGLLLWGGTEVTLGLVCGIMSHKLPLWLFLSFLRTGEHGTSSWALWAMSVGERLVPLSLMPFCARHL